MNLDFPTLDPETVIFGLSAALFGLALLALLIWAFRIFFGEPGTRGSRRGREKRLGVVETAAVDAKRKLYLIRRDAVEHLVIIGGPVDLVIEAGIKPAPQREQPQGEVLIARPASRPAVNYQIS